MADVVMVVDMLKGFLEPGYPLFCGSEARGIIPHIQNLLQREKARGSTVIFIADNHAPDDTEFRMFPPHCIAGSAESEIIDELQDYAGTVIAKQRYSGFFNTALERELCALNPGKIIICGVCTDICVLYTAADARNRDYAVTVAADCVASFDPAAHDWALKHMHDILGVEIVSTLEGKNDAE